MIVSHEYRFILIHCRKVAGSAMKVALSRHLGPRDIVIGSLHEIILAGIEAPPALQSILNRPFARAITVGACLFGRTLPEAQNIAVKQSFRRALGLDPPHPPATRAAAFLGADWDRYTKVCFTRNPFEQIASDYHFHRRVVRRAFTFDEFVAAQENPAADADLNGNAVTNWDMISIDDRLVVDHVGRYERLEADFADIVRRLDLPETPLGREKMTGARERKDYAALYTPEIQARVERLFARELRAFDYSFPY